ncbi:hypothetical protein C8R48DRAFT_101155 [Suillus tomentosus]|nr:hypothetical protein C8R48DRAFT_101155 [Suillus tomentosus]
MELISSQRFSVLYSGERLACKREQARIYSIASSPFSSFSYYTRYVRDDRWLKTAVAIIFMMNAAQTMLIMHGAYAYLVIHFGDFSFFEMVLPVSSTGFLLSALVSVCVQGIFVVKAQRLSETRSRVLPSLWVRISSAVY